MLSQLRDIVEQVSKVEDVYQALDIFVKQTCEAMSTECCTVYLANEEMHRLELMATQGLKFKGDKIHIDFDEGLVGLVKRSAEPINLAEASKHPSFKYFKQLGEEVYHSFLGTPIIYRKQVLGVLVVQQKSPRLFSEMEVSFLVTLLRSSRCWWRMLKRKVTGVYPKSSRPLRVLPPLLGSRLVSFGGMIPSQICPKCYPPQLWILILSKSVLPWQ